MDVLSAYQDTLQYLYERLPMFSRLGKDAIKNDLTNITAFCEVLQHPEQAFKSIHIAGTNGKGSTSHMLSAVLQEAGYKVGLYTSPHLVDFRERIRINGQPVSREWVIDFVETHRQTIETIEPSFFEITVAMAFQLFKEQEVDIAVIETGLGGRLDSTNIITPMLSIITNISYDHKDILGNTLKEIASEKAGIIKHQVPVLIGEQQEETSQVFFQAAVHQQSTIYYADASWDLVRVKQDGRYQHYKAVQKGRMKMYDLETDLLGSYQQHNIKNVLAATEILIASQGLHLSIETALSALRKVKMLSGLRGRWEQLKATPLVIADVAHNPAGLNEVMKQWNAIDATTKHIVTGFVKDKDVAEALSYFPKDAVYYFCQAGIPRALPVADLSAMAQQAGLEGAAYNTVTEAVQAALNALGNDDALLITGSFFIVGDAIASMEEMQNAKVS